MILPGSPADGPDAKVRTVDHCWIPTRDGTRLAARIWLPEDADARPVPAILEYIPYRKNDATAARDLTIHPEFAKAGYASIRVDLRGSGDSDGIMADEYAQSELDDGLDVISWIAAQPWCDGGVGVIGKSWGGFNGLQLAELRPPALKAVISVCSTDDRYRDDVHYNGGAILASEMLSWASTMLAYSARPPDPAVVGADWREQWIDRMRQNPINSEIWLAHQRRDDYWRHASVCENYPAIEVPILAVGGLYDEYRTTLFTLMENCAAPVQALLGPWAHNYPHQGVPGPSIDFIADAVNWWDHWLKGIDNGVAERPQLRCFLPSSEPPDADKENRKGRWISESRWPSPHVAATPFTLAASTANGVRDLSSAAAEIGAAAGDWLQFGEAAGQQIDQREDDARSRTYDWTVDEPVEILGVPQVRLTVASDQSRGLIAVRLCDVAPDGSSRLITAALRNLTHLDGDHEHPVDLTPGEPRTVTVPMLATAHRFEAGQRIRLSVSATYWPWAWPSPDLTTITLLEDGGDHLQLPMRTRTADVYREQALDSAPPQVSLPIDISDPTLARTVIVDDETGAVTITTASGADRRDHRDDTQYHAVEGNSFRFTTGDPLSAVATSDRTEHLTRAATSTEQAWDARVETSSHMSCDASDYRLTNEIVAYDQGAEVYRNRWEATVPRDFT